MSLWREVETSELMAWRLTGLLFLLDRRERGLCHRSHASDIRLHANIVRGSWPEESYANIVYPLLGSFIWVYSSRNKFLHMKKKTEKINILKQTATTKRGWVEEGYLPLERLNWTGYPVQHPHGHHLTQVYSVYSCHSLLHISSLKYWVNKSYDNILRHLHICLHRSYQCLLKNVSS